MEPTAEGRTYPQWRRLIAERNTAIENANFWRRSTFVLAGLAILGNIVTAANWMGWV